MITTIENTEKLYNPSLTDSFENAILTDTGDYLLIESIDNQIDISSFNILKYSNISVYSFPKNLISQSDYIIRFPYVIFYDKLRFPVIVINSIERSQRVSYNTEYIYAETHEKGFDIVTMMFQAMQQIKKRSLQLHITEHSFYPPEIVPTKNEFMKWNEANNEIICHLPENDTSDMGIFNHSFVYSYSGDGSIVMDGDCANGGYVLINTSIQYNVPLKKGNYSLRVLYHQNTQWGDVEIRMDGNTISTINQNGSNKNLIHGVNFVITQSSIHTLSFHGNGSVGGIVIYGA